MEEASMTKRAYRAIVLAALPGSNADIVLLTSQYSGMQLIAAIDAELREKNGGRA